MNRQSMLKDIKKWERRLLVGEWLTMTFPDGKQTKLPPLPCNFHRGVDALMAELGDGDAIAKMAARLFGSQQLGKQDLDSLRRATRIEGPVGAVVFATPLTGPRPGGGRTGGSMKDHIDQGAYSHTRHCGVVFMQEGHVASMDGAVALFERIDPAVERVLAYSGNQHTADFVRRKGTWTESLTQKGVRVDD